MNSAERFLQAQPAIEQSFRDRGMPHHALALRYVQFQPPSEQNFRDMCRLRDFPRKHAALCSIWGRSYPAGLTEREYYEAWKKLGDYENPAASELPPSELQSLRKKLAGLRTRRAAPNEQEREQIDSINSRIEALENESE